MLSNGSRFPTQCDDKPDRNAIRLSDAGPLCAFVIVDQESGGVHVIEIGEYWDLHRSMLDYAGDSERPEWHLVVPIKWEIDSDKMAGLLEAVLAQGGAA